MIIKSYLLISVTAKCFCMRVIVEQIKFLIMLICSLGKLFRVWFRRERDRNITILAMGVIGLCCRNYHLQTLELGLRK